MNEEDINRNLEMVNFLLTSHGTFLRAIRLLIHIKGNCIRLNNANISQKVVQKFEIIKRSLTFRESDPEIKAEFLTHLGELYRNLSENKKSQSCYETALEIYEFLKKPFESAQLLANLSTLAELTSDLATCFTLLEQLEKKASLLKTPQKEIILARYYSNKGALQSKNGEPQKALKSYYTSVEIRTNLQPILTNPNHAKINQEQLFHCKKELGTLALEQGRWKMASQYYHEVLPYYLKTNNKKYVRMIQKGLAKIYWGFRKFEKAIEVLKHLEQEYQHDCDQINALDIKNFIMSLYLSINKKNEARSISSEIKRFLPVIKNSRIEIEYYNNCGWLFQLEGKYSDAIDAFNNAYELAFTKKNFRLQLSILRNFFSTYYFQQNFHKALQYAEMCLILSQIQINSVSSPELRIIMRKEDIILYKRLCKIYIHKKDFGMALHYLDQSKGIELRISQKEKAQQLPLGSNDFQPFIKIEDVFTRLHALRSNVEGMTDDIIILEEADYHDLDETFNHLIQDLKQEYYQLQEYQWATQVPKKLTDTILDFLGAKNILELEFSNKKWYILYFFYELEETTLWIFGLHPSLDSSTEQIKINLFQHHLSPSTYKSLISRQHKIAQFSNQEDDVGLAKILKELSFQLYRSLILQELSNELDHIQPEFLIIIPIERLHELPYEVLFDGSEYWGLKYSMCRSISLTMLETFTRAYKTPSKLDILILAPETNDLQTSEEYSSIKTIIERNHGRVTSIIPQKVIKSNFLSELNNESYSIIHFSGHATFSGDLPESSSIQLKDGNIYAKEISQYLKYQPSRLIVLNACETGLAHFKLGNEPVGLIRGFLEAGAQSMLLTGWSIADNYACDYARYFYNKICDGKPVATAAKEARIAIQSVCQQVNDSEEIVYWSAYRVLENPFLIFLKTNFD